MSLPARPTQSLAEHLAPDVPKYEIYQPVGHNDTFVGACIVGNYKVLLLLPGAPTQRAAREQLATLMLTELHSSTPPPFGHAAQKLLCKARVTHCSSHYAEAQVLGRPGGQICFDGFLSSHFHKPGVEITVLMSTEQQPEGAAPGCDE